MSNERISQRELKDEALSPRLFCLQVGISQRELKAKKFAGDAHDFLFHGISQRELKDYEVVKHDQLGIVQRISQRELKVNLELYTRKLPF